ncbi:UBX domain-containing protein 1 [Homalodisca vitripennis]|uniref:UBX domain-containing protein 1 n=1 Tax=Homalodisca vitripennis TaxID=197043 RepID=UPI001EEB5463|nr:UBX domain-containing protein 1 [Homalodisca vitripennis]
MSSSDVQMLVEMGFTEEKAAKALAVTGNQGVEPAMEWLLAHAGELDSQAPPQAQPAAETLHLRPSMDQPAEATTASEVEAAATAGTAEAGSEVAKSLKCDECGKLFKNQLEVEFHAAKSGHSSFSESTEEKKPLSEEERREQLRLVEEKLKQKRKEREEKEKLEALEREKNRIKSGKEMVAAKKKLEEEEIKKIVEQRKREKEEDKAARERVKAQIEADRAARKAKFGGVSAEPVATPPPAPAPVPAPAPISQARDYTTTRIQIRLTNGQTLQQTFNPKEQLSAVRLYVEMNRSDGDGPFSLMTNFPKKIFQDEDYEKPLDLLGLVPSAVVIVSRALH